MELQSSQPVLEPADLRAARRHLRRLRALIQFCVIAVLVNALTADVNPTTLPHRLWFLCVALGSAIALAFAALRTFGRDLRLGCAWQQRNMREFPARQAH